jgi:hypothetical protein
LIDPRSPVVQEWQVYGVITDPSDWNSVMTKMFLHHPVADFDKWRSAFDGDAPRRDAAGLTNVQVLRDADDPNSVWLVADGEASKMEVMLSDPQLRKTMQAAGVTAPPDLFVSR